MLLQITALRISDVGTFRKDVVSSDPATGQWQFLVRTQKTGDPVSSPDPPEPEIRFSTTYQYAQSASNSQGETIGTVRFVPIGSGEDEGGYTDPSSNLIVLASDLIPLGLSDNAIYLFTREDNSWLVWRLIRM